jgi:hypothetical protein
MNVALPFVLQLLQLAPTLAGAAQTVHAIFTQPGVTVTDSSGAALSAAALADLKAAAARAMASAVTGVQAAG